MNINPRETFPFPLEAFDFGAPAGELSGCMYLLTGEEFLREAEHITLQSFEHFAHKVGKLSTYSHDGEHNDCAPYTGWERHPADNADDQELYDHDMPSYANDEQLDGCLEHAESDRDLEESLDSAEDFFSESVFGD